MKFLICLLSALLLTSFVAGQSAYVQVPQQEIISSALINELLEYGLDYNFEKAGEKYNISTDNLAVTKINSVSRQVLRDRTNYKFNVEATNNNDATMNATYTIEYRPKNGQKVVREWRYKINYTTKDTEEEVDSSYVLLSESQILNSTLVISLLKYGVAYSFEKASERYGVSNDNITVTKINSVERQQLKDKANYRFSVIANSVDVSEMKTNFTIEYKAKGEKKIVRKWWYHINYKDNEDEVEEDIEDDQENEECILEEEELEYCEIAEEGEVDVAIIENEEDVLVVDVEIEVDVDVETSVDNSTDYQKCTEKEVQNNPVINELLGFGLAYVFDKANQKYGISEANLEVTKINSVFKQQLKNSKLNYKFDIAATNNDDATMTATFTIEYNSKTKEKIVREWRYKINYQTENNQQ